MSSTCTPSPVREDDVDFPEVGIETWMVFIDPEAGARASRVIALAYMNHLPVRAKETCFGLMIEGERKMIRGFAAKLRDTFPSGIYLKRRPFSINDTRICARTFDTLGLRRAAEQCRFHNKS